MIPVVCASARARALAPALALAALLAGGCRAGNAATLALPLLPPTALRALKPFFIPGETITWKLSLGGMNGGRARLAIGSVSMMDGHPVVVARAEAESGGVLSMVRQARDAVASWIDVDSGVPRRTESETAAKNKALVVHAARVLGEPLAELRVWRKKSATDAGEGLAKAQRLPVIETHDPLSAVLALRAWNAPLGARAVMYSLGGVRVWRTVFTMEGHEQLRSALGRRRTVRIAAVATRLKPSLEVDRSKKPRRFTVWVTDDAQRIPIQIRASTDMGDVIARATSYELVE